jgi:hypothetical protein
MPPWLDVTLYDLAARNVLRGGVAYRDIFDTNLPGPLWLHMLVRAAFGYRSEVIRLLDVCLVGAAIFLLVEWQRPLGLSRTARVGLAFILSAFYLSTPELCHCQRDMWMLLPALAGLHLRRRQLADLTTDKLSLKRLIMRGIAEGCCWALAFWIKPFVAVPAVVSWLLAALLARQGRIQVGRRLTVDAASVLLGGLATGGAGVAWMIGSGAWQPFLHIMAVWNPEYVAHAQSTPVSKRALELFGHFQVWDLIHLAAVPLAVVTVGKELWSKARPDSGRNASVLLAGFYLAWLGQVVFLQQMHEYIQAPALLIGLTFVFGFVATLRRLSTRLVAGLGLSVFLLAALSQHPLLRLERLALWPRCWTEGSSAELRNQLSLVRAAHSPDWVQLEAIAEYLRHLDLKDRALTCYNDSTHPLYLMLDLEPSTPFLHFGLLLRCCPGRVEDIREALAMSPQRYVVSDLHDVLSGPVRVAADQSGEPYALPERFPAEYRGAFPWTEPVVFRAGRYVVHDVSGSVGSLLPRTSEATNPAAVDTAPVSR